MTATTRRRWAGGGTVDSVVDSGGAGGAEVALFGSGSFPRMALRIWPSFRYATLEKVDGAQNGEGQRADQLRSGVDLRGSFGRVQLALMVDDEYSTGDRLIRA
ncbi:hypothetical protein ACWD8I_03580 [Micromonospora arida]|uniref:hypothetical protein n=1 Tax=Micromonospora arida TaxID=2203715 RepID=UPI0033E70331